MARKEFVISIENISIHVNQAEYIDIPSHASFNSIPFTMNKEKFKNLIQGKFLRTESNSFTAMVEFNADLGYFKRMHEALEMLPEEALQKIMGSQPSPQDCTSRKKHLWPPIDRRKDRQKYKMELDSSQYNIVCNALEMPSIPLVITGSFGTGKTRLLARLAYNTACESDGAKVLLVAHHQSCVDTFTQYLDVNNYSRNKKLKAIRILRHGIEKKASVQSIKEMPINLLNKSILEEATVVITTIGTSFNLLSKVPEAIRVGYFTHVFIDEAAQIREPEAIIPLSFASSTTKLVVAGDHCQVNPVKVVIM